ncbi:MAG: DUF262 domain-containing protein [Selenomonadaceae bacterium]|nr:DUF262 domain-containing protein [Selenomonadaceae bacterium]
MGYETPISVKELVEGINRKYYLPSIQREFVWDTDRIAKLFDSLMQGFPIGSFLFWEVPKDKIEEFSFYKFMETFHALNDTHNKPAHLLASDFPITAILDGQQRMTSLYIGLIGTYAEKLKYKRKNDGTAYPNKKLYLNLMNKLDANTSDNKLELTYAFKFLEPSVVEKANKSDKEHWFEVGKILKPEFDDPYGIICYLAENNLTNYTHAGKILSELKKNIWDNKPISFYLEKSTDLNTVVNIFIRVNSGGLVLSHSDLLLSFATAQLHGVQDFRGDIYNFVDKVLNNIGGSNNFAFDKDFVLKAILVLSDLNVKFNPDNFKRDNMLTIHDRWYDVTEAIEQAVGLISSYGFNKTNMVSANVVIPIAYYILKKGNNSALDENDRKIIRRWFVVASLGGVFSSSTDTVLTSLRDVIIKNNNTSFPAQKMLLDKNALSIDNLINAILNTEYKDKSITMAMSILYPHINLANNYHIDHIFPQSKFKKKFFTEKNITDIVFYMDNLNSFANLQLLPATQNQSKNDKFFDEWLEEMSPADREAYMKEHYIPTDIDLSFGNFKEFIQRREELIRQRLTENLKSWNIFA